MERQLLLFGLARDRWPARGRQPRLGRSNTWSSMVHSDGRLYVLTHNGDTPFYGPVAEGE